jgi:hypothetical protein
VEVNHVIEPGMVTYPGLPVPEAMTNLAALPPDAGHLPVLDSLPLARERRETLERGGGLRWLRRASFADRCPCHHADDQEPKIPAHAYLRKSHLAVHRRAQGP